MRQQTVSRCSRCFMLEDRLGRQSQRYLPRAHPRLSLGNRMDRSRAYFRSAMMHPVPRPVTLLQALPTASCSTRLPVSRRKLGCRPERVPNSVASLCQIPTTLSRRDHQTASGHLSCSSHARAPRTRVPFLRQTIRKPQHFHTSHPTSSRLC
jgi:hypothetical protein